MFVDVTWPCVEAWQAKGQNGALCSGGNQESGPSGWGPRAESRGCVCCVLGALSEIPDRISQERQVPCWIQLPVFSPLWSRTDSLASQKYVTHKI